jgi:hypothetical protein
VEGTTFGLNEMETTGTCIKVQRVSDDNYPLSISPRKNNQLTLRPALVEFPSLRRSEMRMDSALGPVLDRYAKRNA